MKVLIILHGAIGDVTRGLSVAVRIKHTFPHSRISWGVEPISAPLVQNHPAIDRVVVFKRGGGLSAYRAYISELRQEQYDVALDLQRHLKSGATTFLSGAKRRIGFHRKNAKEGNWLFRNESIPEIEEYSPKINQYQLFADALGASPMTPLQFGLLPTPEAQSQMEALLRAQFQGELPKLVSLLVGSTWESRLWTAEHYAALIQELYTKKGTRAVIIGGAREREFAEQILALAPSAGAISLAGQTSLKDLPALLRLTSCAIGSDSGPMHIAAAVGIPVISLWGATSHIRSAPYGSEHLVLASPIGCSPCFKRRCPGLGQICMKEIPPGAVLAMMAKIGV